MRGDSGITDDFAWIRRWIDQLLNGVQAIAAMIAWRPLIRDQSLFFLPATQRRNRDAKHGSGHANRNVLHTLSEFYVQYEQVILALTTAG